MPFIQTADRTSLYYNDWGAGPPVIFIAGWGLSSRMWQYQTVPLAGRGLRCIAYDRRGHGRSDDPGAGYDYDTLADDLRSLVDHLDVRGATLVSLSMGSGEIVRYLSRHGDSRVARIVLVAPTTPFVLKTADNPDGVDASDMEAARAVWTRDFAGFLDASAGPYVGEGLPGCTISDGVIAWTKLDMLSASLPALVACNRAASETDFREEMARIKVPSLVIHGDADRSASLETGGRRSAGLLSAELIVYENAAHGLYLTHAGRLNNDLLAFVRNEAVVV